MIRHIFLLLLVSACYPHFAAAQQKNNTLLWKVSGKGLSRPSYLFGTNHSIGGAFVDSFPVVAHTMAETEVFVWETVPDASPVDYSKFYYFEDGRSMKDFMTDTSYAAMMEYFRRALPEGDSLLLKIPNMKPQLLNLLLLELKGDETSGNTVAEPNVDDHLYNMAAGMKHPVKGLETVLDKLRALDQAAGYREAATSLMARIQGESGEKDNRFLEEVNAAYRIRRIEYAFNASPADQYGKTVGTMRNNLWMEKLPAMIAENACFIAVGIDHLRTKDGLIMQLRRLGYRVEPVMMEKGKIIPQVRK